MQGEKPQVVLVAKRRDRCFVRGELDPLLDDGGPFTIPQLLASSVKVNSSQLRNAAAHQLRSTFEVRRRNVQIDVRRGTERRVWIVARGHRPSLSEQRLNPC